MILNRAMRWMMSGVMVISGAAAFTESANATEELADAVVTEGALKEYLEAGVNVTLAADIEVQNVVNVAADKTVELNLNGKSLMLKGAGARKIQTQGNLTIRNGKIANDNSGAYGLIDDYGSLVLEGVELTDVAAGDGAAVKVRSAATAYVRNSVINATADDIKGNAGITSEGYLTVEDSEISARSGESNANGGAYALIVRGIEASVKNTKIYGGKGALAVDYGFASVENGDFVGHNYYGIWVTNDKSTGSGLIVDGGRYVGKKYGLLAAVDDGRQDEGDADIEIKNGTFIGETKGAAFANEANSEKSWAMDIKSGYFSSDVEKYIHDGHVQYAMPDDTEIKYVVSEPFEVGVDSLEVIRGETVEWTVEGLPTSGAKPKLTWVIEDDGAVEMKETTDVAKMEVTGLKVGETKVRVVSDWLITDTDGNQAPAVDLTATLTVVPRVYKGEVAEDGSSMVVTKPIMVDNKALEEGVAHLKITPMAITNKMRTQAKDLKTVYDVSLLDNTENVLKVSDSELRITLKLGEKELGHNYYKVVYINDDGVVEEWLDAEVEGEYLSFVTSHLSSYGIVAADEPIAPETQGVSAPEAGMITEETNGGNMSAWVVWVLAGIAVVFRVRHEMRKRCRQRAQS